MLLWDGNRYDRNWLDANYPGIATYAESHPRLEELLPDSRMHFLKQLWRFGVSSLIAFDVAALLMADVRRFQFVGTTEELLTLNLVWLGALFALSPLSLCMGSINFCLSDGLINGTHQFNRCRWYSGKMRWCGRLRNLRRHDGAITIVMPVLPARKWMSYFFISFISKELSCGFDGEAAKHWQAILEIGRIKPV